MKRNLFLSVVFFIIISAAVAVDKDSVAMDFIKTLISKAQSENGYTNAIRFFQYTSTTAKNNPSSYVLSKWGKEAVTESGLKSSDKGKYISALSNRSGARIEKLWKANKDEIFKFFSKAAYENILKYDLDRLIEFRSSDKFDVMLKKIKAKSKRPGVKTMDIAGEITGWTSYKELTFWYRRNFEKNDKVVLDILKEMQANYGK